MKVITTRIEDKFFNDLIKIEKEEHSERAEVVRRLLAKAIKEWKLKKALELLKERKITIRKAAEIAELPYNAMLQLQSKSGIDIGYTLEDLNKDIKNGSS
tara:strand:+ start:706 stop:1005 length:300 start_codon:yes stop_codon:yes gene_type:complete